MKNLTGKLMNLVIWVAIGIVAFTIGKNMGRKSNTTQLVNNYSFVKNIIELAGLQVSGTTTFKSTNADSTASFWGGLKNMFAESTATIMVPYTAKFGVVFADSIQIERQDSSVIITMPAAQLLSLELHMDRLETTSRKGLLVFEEDDYFNSFQKKLYADTRSQLAANTNYLQQSAERIEKILNQYYEPLGLKAVCQYRK